MVRNWTVMRVRYPTPPANFGLATMTSHMRGVAPEESNREWQAYFTCHHIVLILVVLGCLRSELSRRHPSTTLERRFSSGSDTLSRQYHICGHSKLIRRY